MNEYRCPKCGSVEVGVDFARSVFKSKWMACYACSYGSYMTWNDQDEWRIEDQDRGVLAELGRAWRTVASRSPPHD